MPGIRLHVFAIDIKPLFFVVVRAHIYLHCVRQLAWNLNVNGHRARRGLFQRNANQCCPGSVFPVQGDYNLRDTFYASRSNGEHHAQDIMADKMVPIVAAGTRKTNIYRLMVVGTAIMAAPPDITTLPAGIPNPARAGKTTSAVCPNRATSSPAVTVVSNRF